MKPLRILLAHNYYGSSSPSGENQVFESERELLRQRGYEVFELIRRSDEIRANGALGIAQGALATPWNSFAAAAIRRAVDAFQPDVVHVHNSFPLLSPAIFHAVGNRAARVLTLHNYRLFCPAAIPMREGSVCTECLDGHSILPALRHGCYRDSWLATLPLAFNVWLHRTLGTWTRQADAFIALTEFQRDLMVEAGLPAGRTHVKPNFYPGNPKPIPWDDRSDYMVFAGRLAPEKGVETLVRAWLKWDGQAPELRVLGDGPLRDPLERLVASAPAARVRFFGQVSPQNAQNEIAGAKLLILPSQWFEGFPMVIREAFAFAVPAAVSAIGALPSIVQDGISGVVFSPGDSQSLLQRVREAWESPGMLERLSAGARNAFERFYTEDSNYKRLMEIYDLAIAVSKSRRNDGHERN
jgi:glycosyltransferase involved in cell wall biosynthesis